MRAFSQAAVRRRDVAGAVLRLPGKALAHRAPLDLIAERSIALAFACRPRALDELHHADPPAVPKRAQREAEGRGRLALAGAGMDDQQALFEDRLDATSASCAALRFAIFALCRSLSGSVMTCLVRATVWRPGSDA